MIGKPIVSRFLSLNGRFRLKNAARPDLHTAWCMHSGLPEFVSASPIAQRYLELLGPLGWQRLPERNLMRNWGQPAIPYAAFIAAYLIKLNEGQKSLGDLRVYLGEHPELIWVLGFPLAVSNPSRLGFDPDTSLPTARHLTRMLREMPNAVLQVLLADSVHLIRDALAFQGIDTGECISLDTKHVIGWVKENNPKAYVSQRYDKTRQPAGDPDCKLGCKRRHNRRKDDAEPGTSVPTPTKNPIPVKDRALGEFYWGYGSGVVAVKVPGWGEFVLAELTQTFDRADTTYFFPLMTQVEQRLGFRPRWGAFDAGFDAWYVYAHFHRPDDPTAFAAVPFSAKGGYKAKGRRFSPEGLPLCAAELPMPLKLTFTDRTRAIIAHERGKYVCPLLFPQPNGHTRRVEPARPGGAERPSRLRRAGRGAGVETCPLEHKNWPKGGCTTDMPTSIGSRLRYTLDRESQAYKEVYQQRTAVERINSQAFALGIERPHLRNGAAIANQNTLTYLLINLRLLQRILRRQTGSK